MQYMLRLPFLIAFISLLILCSAQVMNAQVRTGAISDWVSDIVPEYSGDIDKEKVSDGYLYLTVDKQVHLEHKESFYKYEYQIFTIDGVQNASNISVEYDPSYQSLTFHGIYIKRDGQIIDKLDRDAFQVVQRETNLERHIYDGSVTAYINLNDVRVGDIISFSYTIVGRNPIYEGHFSDFESLQFYDMLPNLSLRYVASKNRELHTQFYNSGLSFQRHEDDKYQYLTLNIKEIPGKSPEKQIPSWYIYYPYSWVSDFATWQEVNIWATKVYEVSYSEQTKVSEEVDNIVSKDYLTREEKILQVINFVQDDIRYLGLESGIGSYKPHSPDEVIDQRFGDCKDKSLLLVKMLENLGVEAYPALVNTRYSKVLIDWIPNQNSFDHCVVKVILEGKTYWVDPTINYQGGGLEDIYFPDYGYALVLDGISDGLEKLPAEGKLNKTVIKEIYTATQVDTTVSLSVRTEYYGRQADIQRSDFENKKKADIQKNYLDFYAKLFYSIETTNELNFIDNIADNVFIVEESYKIDSFWTKNNDTQDTRYDMDISAYGLAPYIEDNIVSQDRKMPFSIYGPVEFQHNITIDLPEGLVINDGHDKVESNEVDFERKVERRDNTLFLNYSYRTKSDHVKAEGLKEYASKQNEIDGFLTYSVTYTFFDEDAGASYVIITYAILVIMVISMVIRRLDGKLDPIPHIQDRLALDIGGWLYVFGIMLVIRAIFMIYNLNEGSYFKGSIWDYYLENDMIGITGFLLFELTFNLCSLAFTVYLGFLMVRKRSSTPLMVSYYFPASAVVLLIHYSAFSLAYPDNFDTESFKDVINAFFGAFIWVSYFRNSERVRHTFLKRVDPDRKKADFLSIK